MNQKLFAISTMADGKPNIDFSSTPVAGYVLCDQLGQYGAYLFSGSPAQLNAINILGNVVGICLVSEDVTYWPELDNVIVGGVRTQINTWLTNRGLSNIPAGWTNRQVINQIYQRFNQRFDLGGIYVA